ncbi:MAG: SAP domain-containing protein [Gammaproteobacteria bacterium]|nr:SAP domain-containing protein [Gammaproteobacteria bacterium]
MNMQQIRSIARSINLKPGKLPKKILIRSIQSSEGNFDCFATAISGYCDQDGCIWRDDCLSLSQKTGKKRTKQTQAKHN